MYARVMRRKYTLLTNVSEVGVLKVRPSGLWRMFWSKTNECTLLCNLANVILVNDNISINYQMARLVLLYSLFNFLDEAAAKNFVDEKICEAKPLLPLVWPDLAKFRHFGKTFKTFAKCR